MGGGSDINDKAEKNKKTNNKPEVKALNMPDDYENDTYEPDSQESGDSKPKKSNIMFIEVRNDGKKQSFNENVYSSLDPENKKSSKYTSISHKSSIVADGPP